MKFSSLFRKDKAAKGTDAPDTAVITCCHIVEDRKPILYVSHDADDGMWQFLCGKEHTTAEARVVSLGEIFDFDPSARALRDMPCGCCAARENLGDSWTVRKR